MSNQRLRFRIRVADRKNRSLRYHPDRTLHGLPPTAGTHGFLRNHAVVRIDFLALLRAVVFNNVHTHVWCLPFCGFSALNFFAIWRIRNPNTHAGVAYSTNHAHSSHSLSSSGVIRFHHLPFRFDSVFNPINCKDHDNAKDNNRCEDRFLHDNPSCFPHLSHWLNRKAHGISVCFSSKPITLTGRCSNAFSRKQSHIFRRAFRAGT